MVRLVTLNRRISSIRRFELISFFYRSNHTLPAMWDSGAICAVAAGDRIARQAIHFHTLHIDLAGDSIGDFRRSVVLITHITGHFGIDLALWCELVPLQNRRNSAFPAIVNSSTIITVLIGYNSCARQTLHRYPTYPRRTGDSMSYFYCFERLDTNIQNAKQNDKKDYRTAR